MLTESIDQTEKIKATLEIIEEVFERSGVNYRILGSVLVAALNGKPHRKLNDIDILVDKDDFIKARRKLELIGYKFITRNMLGLKWFEAEKEGLMGLTFLMIGSFSNKYFYYRIGRLELRVMAEYISPTSYQLGGHTLTGIPVRSVYEGLKISNLNPKRKNDFLVVTNIMKGELSEGPSLEEAFRVYLFNLEVPYAYPLFSKIYNVYGGLRVRFGKKYEVW